MFATMFLYSGCLVPRVRLLTSEIGKGSLQAQNFIQEGKGISYVFPNGKVNVYIFFICNFFIDYYCIGSDVR